MKIVEVTDCSIVLLGEEVKFQVELVNFETHEVECILLDDKSVRRFIGCGIPYLAENLDVNAKRLQECLNDSAVEFLDFNLGDEDE